MYNFKIIYKILCEMEKNMGNENFRIHNFRKSIDIYNTVF